MNKLLLIILNCCLGSLFMGFCLGQMNVISSDVYNVYKIDDTFTKGLMQSLLTIGGGVGSISASILMGLFSRRKCLQITDLFGMMAIMIAFMDESKYALLTSRFFVGLVLGLNGVLVPVYINEMSPKEKAGILGTMNQLFITLGILTTFLMSSFQDFSLPIPFYKMMLYLPIIPCIIRASALSTVFKYETPVYCAKHHLNQQLHKVVEMIYEEKAEKMYEQFQSSQKSTERRMTINQLLSSKYRSRLFIGISLASLQQLGGINGIMFYSSSIFDQVTGQASKKVFYLNLIVGFIGVFTALLATVIIEQFGRKPILKYGTLWCFISLLMLTFVMSNSIGNTSFGSYLIVICIFSYLFGFGFSLGPLLFIYLTEILPDLGVSFSGLMNWMSGGLVAQMFPIIASYDISYCFALFSIFNFIAYMIIQQKVIETKGLDKEAVDKCFENQKFDYIPYQEAYQEDRFR
ncbi:unnamed protein product [Paramecium primaurelia]|uniref:Major facilitator superfamily (MFS) profile domain-containing protein n=1 Tax=Paramecium primaurelia TaxID=5886 RepID=A0A8S1NLC3_PARPR|nr:unnamed protein product [Paramecium primaurelia]